MGDVISLADLLFPKRAREIDQTAAGVQQLLQQVSPSRSAPVLSPATASGSGIGSVPQVQQANPTVRIRTTPLTPATVPIAWNVHPSPVGLAHAWLAVQSPGIAQLLYASQVIAIPAQQARTFTFQVPDGMVMIEAEPLRSLPDLWSPALTARVIADEYLIADQFVLSRDSSSNLPEWTFIQRILEATYTNGDWEDITVTIRAHAVLMEATIFWETFMPILQEVVHQWEAQANRLTQTSSS